MLLSQPLWEGVAVMKQSQFGQVKQYGAMLAIANRLHTRGLTTDTEHRKLIDKLQKEYRTVVSFPQPGEDSLANHKTEPHSGKGGLTNNT